MHYFFCFLSRYRPSAAQGSYAFKNEEEFHIPNSKGVSIQTHKPACVSLFLYKICCQQIDSSIEAENGTYPRKHCNSLPLKKGFHYDDCSIVGSYCLCKQQESFFLIFLI